MSTATSPITPAFGWYAARIAEQQSVLDELTARPVTFGCCSHPTPPANRSVRRRSRSCWTKHDAGTVGTARAVVARRRPRVGVGLDAVLSHATTVATARRDHPEPRAGDDLIITVGGLRRRVRLASVPRRCIVAAPRCAVMSCRCDSDPIRDGPNDAHPNFGPGYGARPVLLVVWTRRCGLTAAAAGVVADGTLSAELVPGLRRGRTPCRRRHPLRQACSPSTSVTVLTALRTMTLPRRPTNHRRGGETPAAEESAPPPTQNGRYHHPIVVQNPTVDAPRDASQ